MELARTVIAALPNKLYVLSGHHKDAEEEGDQSSGVGTGGSDGSMNRGPRAPGAPE